METECRRPHRALVFSLGIRCDCVMGPGGYLETSFSKEELFPINIPTGTLGLPSSRRSFWFLYLCWPSYCGIRPPSGILTTVSLILTIQNYWHPTQIQDTSIHPSNDLLPSPSPSLTHNHPASCVSSNQHSDWWCGVDTGKTKMAVIFLSLKEPERWGGRAEETFTQQEIIIQCWRQGCWV